MANKEKSIFKTEFKSRKQRRLEAKNNGTTFEPQYNGSEPITLAEWKEENEKIREARKSAVEKMLEEKEETKSSEA